MGVVDHRYFGMEKEEMADVILTTDSPHVTFNSLVAWKKAAEGRRVYKVRGAEGLFPYFEVFLSYSKWGEV